VEGAVSWNNRNGRVEVELFRGAGSPQQWTAVVKGSKEDLSLLRFNEHLRGLEVESVDAQKLKVVASMPGLSELVGGRSYIRLEDLKEGDYIDGVVKLVLPNGGAIIDVGAKVDALLVGSTNVTKLIYRCDELHNMSVLEVFPESQKLYVFLKEPAGAVAARAITSKEVKIGSVIRRGRVIDRQPIGVWVDIHAERWAFLDEPPELAFRLDYREEVMDVVVEGVNRNTGVADVKIRDLARKVQGRPEPVVLPAAKRRWARAQQVDRWGTSTPY